jgi:hypothetical protein
MQIINIKKELGGSYTYRRRRMSIIIFINPVGITETPPRIRPTRSRIISSVNLASATS